MTYPENPGFQTHSDTSREAAERLTTGESMEAEIADLLDTYHEGWTGDEIVVRLSTEYPMIQAGTVSARLRGLEHKGMAVQTILTRLTRSGRRAQVWMSPRMARVLGIEVLPDADCMTATEVKLRQEIIRIKLKSELMQTALKKAALHLRKIEADTDLIHSIEDLI